MKLANQIIFLGAMAVSTLFFVIAIILYIEFPREQEKLLIQGGRALVENLRLRINPMVLTDDRLSLNEALLATKRSDKNIIYIFVLDKDGLPLASTYSMGVPKGLIDFVSHAAEENTVKFVSEEFGSCFNVSAPLMGDTMGSLHLGVNHNYIKAFANRSVLKLSITFSIISVLSIALAILIGRGVGKPLSQIANIIRKSESRWPKLEHVKTGPTREVQDFVTIFKQMVNELEEAEQNRQNYERKLLAAERLASTGQLAAEIAHEVNNPLDGMFEISRHMENVADDPEKVRKYTKLMAQGLERIGRMGRQLLNLAQRDITDYRETFNVREMIKNTTELLNSSMKNRGIGIKVSYKRKGYFAIGNAVAIGQVLMNLLLNAADAINGQAGEVKIDVGSENGSILIAVTDDGPGISEEVSKRIFEAFFTTKAENGGTGLGLAVSRNLVEKCGGELLLVERKTENGGARFLIKLKCHIIQEEH